MDLEIYKFITGFAHQSEFFDKVVYVLSQNPMFKSLPPALLFWVLWFYPNSDMAATRRKILAALFIAIVAISASRLAAFSLPFTLRPMFDPSITAVPFDFIGEGLNDWSSFPSGHAVLFFSLAMSFFLINRFAGVIATLHAVVIITIPRIYLGFHWPSDILGGLILGSAISLLLMGPVSRLIDRTQFLPAAMRYEYVLYPGLFFLTFQISTTFNSARRFVSALAKQTLGP